MRIKTTDHYKDTGRRYCRWQRDDCERVYCAAHRLLYRTCETAQFDIEGDRDVPGGLRRFIHFPGDCPTCRQEETDKRIRRLFEESATALGMTLCAVCYEKFGVPDDAAIHLVDTHQWDTERARLWLRDQVEEKAFYAEP